MTTRRAIQLHGIALLAAADSLVVHHLPRPELGWATSLDGRTFDGSRLAGTTGVLREWVGICSITSITSGAPFAGTRQRRGDEFEVRWFRSGTQGRAHYTLSSTEVLHGTWSLDEGSHLGLETLTPNNNP